MRILIMDDDPSRLVKLKRCAIGHVADTAETPQEAIRLFQTKEYDAVFLDYDMPVLIDAHHEVRDALCPANQRVTYDATSCGIVFAEYLAYLGHLAKCAVVIHSLNERGSNAMKCILPHATQWRRCWEEQADFDAALAEACEGANARWPNGKDFTHA